MCVSIRAGIGSINNNLLRQLLLRDENSAADALYYGVHIVAFR